MKEDTRQDAGGIDRAHTWATPVDASDGLGRRVAELQKANAELTRSNAELTEFASIAAHELRAPLQTITGFAELLASHAGPHLDAEAAEYLRDIRRGTARLQVLVDGLLAYARIGTTVRRREEVSCFQLAAEVCEALAIPIAEARATVAYDHSLPVVVGDWGELMQVFQNLIANALAYRRKGVAPRVRILSERSGDMWQIEVEDNGCGIDPRYRDRLFRVFQRLPGHDMGTGTGIGLAICKRIVEGHGGRIWVEDVAEGGTRMFFTIPAAVCWNPF